MLIDSADHLMSQQFEPAMFSAKCACLVTLSLLSILQAVAFRRYSILKEAKQRMEALFLRESGT